MLTVELWRYLMAYKFGLDEMPPALNHRTNAPGEPRSRTADWPNDVLLAMPSAEDEPV